MVCRLKFQRARSKEQNENPVGRLKIGRPCKRKEPLKLGLDARDIPGTRIFSRYYVLVPVWFKGGLQYGLCSTAGPGFLLHVSFALVRPF
jgi:hypothetical protein